MWPFVFFYYCLFFLAALHLSFKLILLVLRTEETRSLLYLFILPLWSIQEPCRSLSVVREGFRTKKTPIKILALPFMMILSKILTRRVSGLSFNVVISIIVPRF